MTALESVLARLIAAGNDRDIDRVLTSYTCDVTWLPPSVTEPLDSSMA